MPKLSGNKGEWSEIYAFLRLLEIKKLYAADAELNKKDDMFYNIINIIRTEPIGTLEFRINRTEDTITVFNTSDSTELLTLPCSEFKNAADRLYCEIIETNASAFALPDTEEFLDTLNIGVLKAKSTDKADIRIKIHDINTGYETVQGFSIKSRLGSPSTLVNAGKTTNFVFEVTGNIDDAVVQEFNTCSKKFKDRFEVLDRNGCDISYDSMENDVFESNLQLIDGDLPKICGYMLKEYYSSGVNTVTNSLESLNVHAFYAETFKIVSNIIQYKIPFYLTFYVSIFKLFMKKRSTNKISGSDFDINRLINIFEDGETSEEYSKLLDYGIPITTITKISNNKISIENLKKRNYDSKIFDEYEKIIIEETINLL